MIKNAIQAINLNPTPKIKQAKIFIHLNILNYYIRIKKFLNNLTLKIINYLHRFFEITFFNWITYVVWILSA